MVNNIRMSVDPMRSISKEYSTEAYNIQQVINKLDILLIQLQQEQAFDGCKAVRSYVERFDELRPELVRTKELIDEISESLQETADEMYNFFDIVS